MQKMMKTIMRPGKKGKRRLPANMMRDFNNMGF
jgi:hypothetical protein